MSTESDLQWAEDIQTVYTSLGRPLDASEADSDRLWHLRTWAQDNPEKFLGALQKATDALRKYRNTDSEEVSVERKAIAELRSMLREALNASESVEPTPSAES